MRRKGSIPKHQVRVVVGANVDRQECNTCTILDKGTGSPETHIAPFWYAVKGLEKLMFRVHVSSEVKEQNVRRCAETKPCQAFLLAIVHVKWNIRRACIALGNEPNVIMWKRLMGASGYSKMSNVWDRIPSVRPLEESLGRDSWLQLSRVFNLKNRIVDENGGASHAYANQMMAVAFYDPSCV